MELVAALQVTQTAGERRMQGSRDYSRTVVGQGAGLRRRLYLSRGQEEGEATEELGTLTHPQLEQQLEPNMKGVSYKVKGIKVP